MKHLTAQITRNVWRSRFYKNIKVEISYEGIKKCDPSQKNGWALLEYWNLDEFPHIKFKFRFARYKA